MGMGIFNRKCGGDGGGIADIVGFLLERGVGISFGILLMLAGLSCGNFPVLDVDTNMRIVLVPYDTPVGTIIYRLRASDSDNNFPLSFEVLGSIGKSILSLRFLGCDQAESLCQADVVLKKALDKGRTYEFQLQVKDTEGDYTKVHSVITATQGTANFNPTFMPRIIHLDESTPVGTELEKFVIAKTLLNSRHVFLEIRDKGDRIALKQRLVSNNQTEGTLLLKKILDYETEPWFTFQLLAMNAYTNTTCDTRNILVSQVIVAVHDVQDTPPYFSSLPASVELKSSMKPGDLIASVKAEDGDKQNKRLIRYGFLTDSNPFVVFFNLDPMSGEIHLRRNLTGLLTMAKPNEPIEMTIIAEEIIPDSGRLVGGKSSSNGGKSSFYDNNSSRAMGKITFWFGRDSSFGPADFSSDKYIGEVKENSVSGTLVHFGSAEPRVSHQHPKEIIALSLQPGGSSNKIPSGRSSPHNLHRSNSDSHDNDLEVAGFQILPSQGSGNFSFEIRVVDSKLLDYERATEFTFLVVAVTSCGMSSEAQVTIHIRDENDEAPVFTQPEYHVELPEHPPKGTRVLQVQAIDKDTTGNFGKVTYSSLIGSNAFRLDPTTGEITVERPDLIDRELEPEIRLYVEAKDGGYSDAAAPTSARNLATAVVVIKLTDKNDHPPKFFQKYYQAVLNPQHTELKEALFVKAFDADEGVNSQIRYEVKDTRFYVDPLTGEFRLRGGFVRDPRDGDNPFLGSVRVYAHDLGNPKLTSETLVQIFAEEMVTREIQFVFPASPDKIRKNKTNFEIMLSKLSGGVAHIQTVAPYHRYPRAGAQVDGGKSNEKGLEATPGDLDDGEIPARFRQTNPENSDSNTALSRRSAELASSTDKSLVTATVQYPVSATPTRVDLSQIPNVYGNGGGGSDTGGGGGGDGSGSTSPDSDKIKVYEAENRALFWILIAFLFILLMLFMVFLCCVYCPWCWLYGHCYSKGDKMSREHSGRSLLIEKRRVSDAHSRHKTYPEKIEDGEGDYDRDGYSRRQPPRGPRHARREAWSGDERKGAWRTSQLSPRSIRRYRNTPPPRARKVGPAQQHETDVALEDWEFDGGPPRQRDQAEEIGSRWQLQQQQQQPMQPIPQGPQMMPVAVPVAGPIQQPRRVAFGHPGQVVDDAYMRRSQEIYIPEENQRGSYAMVRQPPQSLPPGPDERAVSHLQQRKTRFFRTETGEVLQFGDYEGDEGKELLIKRYIDEQQPKELEQFHQQQSFGSQNRSQTPGVALSQPRLDEVSRAPEGGSVDRPKAAIVSRRHPKGVALSKDVTFEEDDDNQEESPPVQKSVSRSDTKKTKSRRSGSESEGEGARRERDREDAQDDMRRYKRAGKETDKKQRRAKSPTPLSEDDSRRSRSPTRKSHHHSQSHNKESKKRSKSPTRSKTRSVSPPPQQHTSKSKSKSPSRSKSRTRSRSVTPPHYLDEKDKRRHKAKQHQQTIDYREGGRQHKLRRHHHIQQSKASSKGEGDYDNRDYRSSHHRLKHKADSKSFKDSREELTREKSEKSLDPSLISLPLSLRGDDDDETEQPSGSTGAIGDEPTEAIGDELTAKTSSATPPNESRTELNSPPPIPDDVIRERRRSSVLQQQSSEEQTMMNQSMVDINVIPPSSAMTDSSYNPRDEERTPPEVENEEERQETAISRSREESVEYESYRHHYGDDDDDDHATTAIGERRRIIIERTDTLPEPSENEMKIASQSTLDIAEAEAAAAALAPSDSVEVPPPDEDEAEERISNNVTANTNSADLEVDGEAGPPIGRRVGGPEEDDDSGIGMAGYLSRRNKMLEKKSVFTIAYDEVAQSAVMRPDTRGSTGDAAEHEASASVIK